MRYHRSVVAATGAALLVAGCAAPPAGRDAEPIAAGAQAPAFQSERTATLWVKGLGCPY